MFSRMSRALGKAAKSPQWPLCESVPRSVEELLSMEWAIFPHPGGVPGFFDPIRADRIDFVRGIQDRVRKMQMQRFIQLKHG